MSSQQPNVIVFFTDQQRWDTVGLHGNPLDLTPNFDRLASLGTFLRNSITCQPLCGPARACMQTGQYATSVGCFRNGIPLPRNVPTLAKAFGGAGYDTGYIGKWHLGPMRDEGSVRGSRTWVQKDWRGGYGDWLAANALEHSSNAYDCRVYNNRNAEVKLPGYRVDALTDAAIRYIAQPRENPFYLFLSFLEPHHQNHLDDYPPPNGYRERYTGRWVPPDLAALGGSAHKHLGGYYGMVKRLDEALGRLFDALISLDLDENTILLFTTDHGCHFKTRNGEYKRSCHESSVRLPTFIAGPGFRGGGSRDEIVSLVDFPPTLLDAAGVAVPDAMQGRSLMPRLRDPSVPWQDDCFIQISESGIGRAVRTERWKYAVDAGVPGGVETASSDIYRESHLFDLWHDPYELENLIQSGSHAGVSEEMRERLLARMSQTGEAIPTIEPADRKQASRRSSEAVSPNR